MRNRRLANAYAISRSTGQLFAPVERAVDDSLPAAGRRQGARQITHARTGGDKLRVVRNAYINTELAGGRGKRAPLRSPAGISALRRYAGGFGPCTSSMGTTTGRSPRHGVSPSWANNASILAGSKTTCI